MDFLIKTFISWLLIMTIMYLLYSSNHLDQICYFAGCLSTLIMFFIHDGGDIL